MFKIWFFVLNLFFFAISSAEMPQRRQTRWRCGLLILLLIGLLFFFVLFWGFYEMEGVCALFFCSQCTRASKLPSKNSGKTFLLSTWGGLKQTYDCITGFLKNVCLLIHVLAVIFALQLLLQYLSSCANGKCRLRLPTYGVILLISDQMCASKNMYL